MGFLPPIFKIGSLPFGAPLLRPKLYQELVWFAVLDQIRYYYNQMRTTQRKGDIATSQAIATFTKLGYDVSLPLTESAAYDLIIDFKNKLKRVQVKYCDSKVVDLRNIHSNSKGYKVKKLTKHKYDWLYILYKNNEYLFKKCFKNRRGLTPQTQNLLKNQIAKISN